MLKYCLKKVGQVAIVMLLISFFSFAIIDLAPGDISSMYLTEDMSPEEKQIVIEKLGLNKSMPEQYWAWLKEALQGNFGVSLSYKTHISFLSSFHITHPNNTPAASIIIHVKRR